jgi:hypothetical protein
MFDWFDLQLLGRDFMQCHNGASTPCSIIKATTDLKFNFIQIRIGLYMQAMPARRSGG